MDRAECEKAQAAGKKEITTTKLIQDRWRNYADASRALDRIYKKLQSGGLIDKRDSPFALRGDDLADLRGIDLSGSKIKRARFDKCDCSFVDLSFSWIEDCTFTDVLFEKSDFSEFADHGNRFDNVVFLNCKFNKGVMGYKGSRYTACRFERSSFRRTGFIRTEFSSCDFVNCNFKGVDMSGSSFEDCKFVGKLDDVWFRGGYGYETYTKEFGAAKKNQMKNVSFEDAGLNSVHFSNDCDLSSIRLPESGDYRLFDRWLYRLERLQQSIPNWPADEQREADIFLTSHLVHAKNQDWYLINPADVEKDYGENVAERILHELTAV